MWRILVVSDSHGRDENVYKALEQAGEINAFIHLGDVGTNYREMMNKAGVSSYIVRGNCDYDYELKERVSPHFGPHRLYCAHGHREGVNAGLNIIRYASMSADCNIAMYGHTHVPLVFSPDMKQPLVIGAKTKADGDTVLSYEGSIPESDVIILNPGSVSLPRQEGGRKTYAVLELGEDGSVKVLIKYLRQ